MATCARCKRDNLGRDDFHFRPNGTIHSWCKNCLKQWRKENPERVREVDLRSKRKPESRRRQKVYFHLHHLRNRQKNNEKCREWRRRNHARNAESIRRWIENNPGRVPEYAKRRAERERNAPGSITNEEAQELKEKYGSRCLACGKHESELSHPLQLDHIVPVIFGGSHSFENRQPICKPCNSRKRTKVIDYRPQE